MATKRRAAKKPAAKRSSARARPAKKKPARATTAAGAERREVHYTDLRKVTLANALKRLL